MVPLQPLLPAHHRHREASSSRPTPATDSSELNLRLRWLAVVSGHVRASLAVSGGVHTHIDAVKAVMTGAHAVQVVSASSSRDPTSSAASGKGWTQWLEEHEYDSLEQMRGSG
ncbi:MAG: hypothetical protein IPF66_20765 [Holophagales bacterium]|nr:hypothetical protein [Holophagales bacterium]